MEAIKDDDPGAQVVTEGDPAPLLFIAAEPVDDVGSATGRSEAIAGDAWREVVGVVWR
jgi:hypothetical protein